jgi:hypothetical protein
MISVIPKVDHTARGSVPYGAGEAAKWPIELIQLVRIDFTGSTATRLSRSEVLCAASPVSGALSKTASACGKSRAWAPQ